MLLKAPATEQALAHRLFATNQATDDHIATAHQGNVKSIQIKPRGTTIVTTDKGVWIAFAESGDVKKLAQTLTKGDAIEVKGLVADDGALHIEKIRLVSKTPKPIRPQCPTCQRTLKSMGTGQGLRCPTCKTKHPRQWQTMAEDDDESEWFEPPFDARRHLARPLNG
jgi:tRNA(Ile2)-agmatinylcytidine synthase